MEPDHAATLSELVLRHPEVTVVCNAQDRRDDRVSSSTLTIDSRAHHRQGGRHAVHRPPHLHLRHGPDGSLAGGHGDLRRDATRYSSPRTPSAPSARSTAGYLPTRCDFETEYLHRCAPVLSPTSWANTARRCRRCCKKAAGIEHSRPSARCTAPVWRKNIGWFIDKYQQVELPIRRRTRP